MSALAYTLIGLAGGATMLFAYAYSNVAKPIDLVLFNALNLAGALMLIVSLTAQFNLASMVLEIAWAGIALFGLVAALRRRGRA